MSIFIFAFFAAVVVFVLVMRGKQNTQEAWMRIATNLRLTYYNVGLPSLRGAFRDRNVHVTVSREGHGSHSQTFTRVEVHFQRFLKTGFRLSRQGYLQAAKSFIGAQDIKVGHPDFDAAVVVKGRDEEAIRELFQSKSVRKACLALIARQRYAEVNITNKKIEVGLPGKVSDTSRIRAALNELVDVAEVLEKKTAPKKVQEAPSPPPLPTRRGKPVVPEEWHGSESESEVAQVPALEETSPESVPSQPEAAPLVEVDEPTPPSVVASEEEVVTDAEEVAVDESISLPLIAETLLEKE